MQVLVRYGAVSLIALAADVLVYTALLLAAWPASLAAGTGYGIGMALHYVLSRQRVFGSQAHGPAARREALGFLATGLAGLALTAGIVHLAVDGFGFNPVIGKGAAIGCSFLTIYLLRRTLVFKPAIA
jgi:putative flippase GtrA